MKIEAIRLKYIIICIFLGLAVSGCTHDNEKSSDEVTDYYEHEYIDNSDDDWKKDVENTKQALDYDDFIFPYEDTKDSITLYFGVPNCGENDTVITWESSDNGVITIGDFWGYNAFTNALVTRPDTGDAQITLTATITKHTVSDTKQFIVTVKQNEEHSYGWTKSFGEFPTNYGELITNSIAVDSADNIYICGFCTYDTDFDPSTEINPINCYNGSVYVSKFSKTGKYLWTKTIFTEKSTIPYSINCDFNSSDNLYISFTYSYEENPDPNPYDTTFYLDETISNIVIVKMNSNSDIEWTRTIGDKKIRKVEEDDYTWFYTRNISCSSMAVDESNGIYITGDFEGEIDFDPGSSIVTFSSISDYSASAYLLKLDSSGNYCWVDPAVTIYEDTAGSSIIQTDNGNIYCYGTINSFYNDPDSFLVQYTADGTKSNTQLFYGTNNSTIHDKSMINTSIIGDSNSNVYLAGSFVGNRDFDPNAGTDILESISADGPDIYITRINSDGSYAWTKLFNSFNAEYCSTVSIDSNDNIYLSGWLQRSLSINSITEEIFPKYTGMFYTYIMKLNTDAEASWIKIFNSGNDFIINDLTVDSNDSDIVMTGNFAGLIDFSPEVDNDYRATVRDDVENTFIIKIYDK
jgi:hypothetical protein